MARTGAVICVRSPALSLRVLSSPPPLTFAKFVTEGPPPSTLTAREMEGQLLSKARASERVQVIDEVGGAGQCQPLPVIAVAGRPPGILSFTVNLPLAARFPMMFTVSEQ